MAELLALDAQADENFRNAIGGTIFRTPEDFVEYFLSLIHISEPTRPY